MGGKLSDTSLRVSKKLYFHYKITRYAFELRNIWVTYCGCNYHITFHIQQKEEQIKMLLITTLFLRRVSFYLTLV